MINEGIALQLYCVHFWFVFLNEGTVLLLIVLNEGTVLF